MAEQESQGVETHAFLMEPCREDMTEIVYPQLGAVTGGESKFSNRSIESLMYRRVPITGYGIQENEPFSAISNSLIQYLYSNRTEWENFLTPSLHNQIDLGCPTTIMETNSLDSETQDVLSAEAGINGELGISERGTPAYVEKTLPVIDRYFEFRQSARVLTLLMTPST